MHAWNKTDDTFVALHAIIIHPPHVCNSYILIIKAYNMVVYILYNSVIISTVSPADDVRILLQVCGGSTSV